MERVFLRIGSAETDDQLESCLDRFLPPVLLKLNSSEEAVRKKVNLKLRNTILRSGTFICLGALNNQVGNGNKKAFYKKEQFRYA